MITCDSLNILKSAGQRQKHLELALVHNRCSEIFPFPLQFWVANVLVVSKDGLFFPTSPLLPQRFHGMSFWLLGIVLYGILMQFQGHNFIWASHDSSQMDIINPQFSSGKIEPQRTYKTCSW